jgi:hypothetical protein
MSIDNINGGINMNATTRKTKKLLALLAACLAITIMLAGCAKDSPKEPETSNLPAAGGYTGDRQLTDEDIEIFTKAMEANVGVGYEPTLVATQVVAGTNYRFTATATPVVPDAVPYTVNIYIYQPLDGAPELTEIVPLDGGTEE